MDDIMQMEITFPKSVTDQEIRNCSYAIASKMIDTLPTNVRVFNVIMRKEEAASVDG